mmetsp:Transcript_9003/g.24954  ORF Transcript_9003/g.24954 Transcript_9003/m.24954 type:complete len:513 (-) Transcript_9003:74-1612(-)
MKDKSSDRRRRKHRSRDDQEPSSPDSSSSGSSRSSRSWYEPPLGEALDSLDREYQAKRSRLFSKTSRNTLALITATAFACLAGTTMKNQGSTVPEIFAKVKTSSDMINSLMPSKRRREAEVKATFALQKDSVDGIYYYYTTPMQAMDERGEVKNITVDTPPIKGILFVAHGCGGSASLYFGRNDPHILKKGDICRHRKACVGAPENRAIVDLAHQRGLMVVAASSWDRETQCWRNRDGARIASVLNHVQTTKLKSTTSTPVYAFGSSSGGELAGWYLPSTYRRSLSENSKQTTSVDSSNMTFATARFDGYIMMNKVPREQYEKEVPAVYIKMPNDPNTATAIEAFAKEKRTGPTREITLPSHQLSEQYFSHRIPDMTLEQSSQIYKSLLDADLLDSDGLSLKAPPKKHNEVIGDLLSKKCGIEDHRDVFDVLNVAYGHHATTRDGVGEALDWLLEHTDKHGSRNSIVIRPNSTTDSVAKDDQTLEIETRKGVAAERVAKAGEKAEKQVPSKR